MMQQYSIMRIVFLYLFLTCWHSHFQFWKVSAENVKRWIFDKQIQLEGWFFSDLDAVYGSDDGLKRKFTQVKHFLIYLEKCLSQLIMKVETDYSRLISVSDKPLALGL